jgi:hypothetical protein
MVNLCKDDHCVRLALEIDGWVRERDGQIVRSPKPPLFLPSLLVANGVKVPAGWVLDPVRDGWMPPATTADATVPASDTTVRAEREL